jgi:hypothetical protein
VSPTPLIPIPLRVGRWLHPELPPVVEIDGFTFERRPYGFGGDGVIAEYQEAVPTLAAHLYVLDNGTWEVDHVDEFHPEDDPLGHWVVDVLEIPGSAAVSLLTGSAILPLF